ncbi:MAG: carboxypeptidase regulatory-like domain-containing protein, partial [Gemmatimonadaceae bacterium]|nr:carboxypeptidase regulatory-like domain-containing protein [Gemmatimonadaceae bacterium]
MKLRLLVAVLLASTPAMASGQVVRGVVREIASGAPLAGVVVSVERAPNGDGPAPTLVRPVAASLTNARGEFELAAPAGERFIVTAKRIGVRQFRSAILTVRPGETRALDIGLEGVQYELPVVAISAATPCGTRTADRGRIAALWAEASAALTASELSLRDRLFRATIVRYQRLLEPRALRVRDESREVRHSVTEHAFVSFPAESLAVVGYARLLDDGAIEHFAPDAQVLLSDEFVRDHCFGLATPRAPEVGITFQPVRRRRVADIEGTMWLDARTFELRRVEFRYTNFPLPVNDSRTGGEVHFARLATGTWYVSRWFMRVPQVEVQPYASVTRQGPRVASQRTVIASFSEVGGRVDPVGDRGPQAALATLNGRVVDSTGKVALGGARVSLVGMPQAATTARDGSFRLDSLPPGNYSMSVEHPGYARLGLTAAEQNLEIGEGTSSITLVQAIGTPQILRQLCGYDQVPDSSVVLRLVVPPSTDPAAPRDTTKARVMHLSWDRIRQIGPGIFRTVRMATVLPVDAAGGVTACALPPEVLVR